MEHVLIVVLKGGFGRDDDLLLDYWWSGGGSCIVYVLLSIYYYNCSLMCYTVRWWLIICDLLRCSCKKLKVFKRPKLNLV